MPNRIDVQLHLMANQDIERLQDLFQQFSTDIGASPSKGSRYTSGGKTTGPMDSRSSQEANERSSGLFKSILGGDLRTYIRSNAVARGLTGVAELGAGIQYGPQLVRAAVAAPMNILGGVVNSGASQNNTAYGASFGLSRSNGLIPAFSSAGRAGAWANTLEPLTHAFDFGFTPSQAKDVNNALQSFGYEVTRGGQGSQMRSAMESISRQYGGALPASQAALMLDPQRYGGGTVTGLTSQIKDLGDAAKATTTTVQHVGEAVQQLGQQLSTQFGVTAQQGQNIGLVTSMATGFSPEVIGNTINSSQISGMMLGQAGGDAYKAFGSPNAGVNLLQANLIMIQRVIGMPIDRAKAVLRAGGPGAEHIRSQIYNAYYYDPSHQIFGGLRPDQVLTMIGEGQSRIMAGAHAASDILSAQQGISHPGLSNLYTEARRAGVSAKDIANISNSSGNYQDKISQLSHKVADATSSNRANSAQQTTVVTLSRDAKKLLRIVPDSSSSDTNTLANPSPYANARIGYAVH